MLNLILFGAPGAGKGTQAKLLTEKYCLKHISTGEVFREEIRNKSPLGQKVEMHIAGGKLVPDEMVIEMIAEYVHDNRGNKKNNGNIFDGFPRTTVQAVEFDKIMDEHKMPINLMISLEVSDEELIKRLLIRGEDSGRPEDVDVDVIRKRLDIYKETTSIVAKHYAAQGKYIAIDGVGEVEEVFDRLSKEVDKHVKKACVCK